MTFVAGIDAEGWLVAQERAISRDEWTPAAKPVPEPRSTLAEFAVGTVGRRRLRPATEALYAVPEARRVPLLLAGWCGLRSGEVRGLRVCDLDLEAGVVHVRQAVVRLTGRLLIGAPKTAARIRTVTIQSPHLLPALREWSGQQRRRSRDALLFPAGDGYPPLNDSVLRDAHDKGKAAIGMPGLTIHGLRHTSATLAAHLGATIAELQARIGHSTPNMAMRYRHVAAERDAQLAARLSSHATGYTWTLPATATAARQAEPTAGDDVQSLLPGSDR